MNWTVAYVHSDTWDRKWIYIEEYHTVEDHRQGAFRVKGYTLTEALKDVAHFQKLDQDDDEVYSYRIRNEDTGQTIIL